MPKQLKDLHLHDLVGGGQSLPILKGLGEPAAPFKQAKFALRTDDLIASWQAIRAGLGVGVAAEYLVSTDPQVSPILPALKIPPMPMWLVAHREIRGNPRIRAVFNFLADAMPRSLT